MNAAWVYRCYDVSGRLLYVGATCDLPTRLATHEHRAWWAPAVAKVKAVVFVDIDTARTAERTAIRRERPRWNIAGRSMARVHWSRDDYADYVLARSMAGNSYTAWCRTHLQRIHAEYRARFGVELQAVPA